MAKLVHQASKKRGLPPGALVHVGRRREASVKAEFFSFDQSQLEETQIDQISSSLPFDSQKLNWLNLDGVHDVEKIKEIGNRLSIPTLVLEDILNTEQRPKIEVFDEFVFVVVKMLRLNEKETKVISEQVSFILGKDYLLSFQEVPEDVFEFVRNRLRKPVGTGRIRSAGSDYLLFALLDLIVDHYLIVLEKFGEKIDLLEKKIFSNATDQLVQRVAKLRRELSFIGKQIQPVREISFQLQRGEIDLVRKENLQFFRDIHDHSLQVIDTLESHRETLSNLMDIHFSMTSHRMNEVMKFLTIYASIFIPLTFIAGIYGMNFEVMPELKWPYSYPAAILVMILITALLLRHFKKKGWL